LNICFILLNPKLREPFPVSSTLPSNLPNPPNQKLHKAPQKSMVQLAVVALLALFVAVSAVPQYVDGWPWANPPKLPAATRNALQTIPDQGLEIPGWVTREQTKTKLGGKNWSFQQLSVAAAAPNSEISPVFLLLRAQTYEADQPEVEWLDIQGSQKWKTDSFQTLTFEVPFTALAVPSPQSPTSQSPTSQSPTSQSSSLQSPSPAANKTKKSQTVRISGDFFRAWSKDQTYAVLQWYAWTNGGGASPAKWFWADQKAQWNRRQRTPWVAVSIWLPIEPFSDIARTQGIAESLGQTLQQTLSQKIFAI
jgi:cyanoexosortase B-associated protein